MKQHRIPAVFMRGGTSKAVMLKRADLPTDEGQWPAIFRAILGSPDPYGRQLDGMGGGLSSLSKICIIAPSQRADADVDYTFAQVSVHDRTVDFSGNCGNMSSAVGPFAVDEGLVATPPDGDALVRIFNTNSGKIIHASFAVADGEASVEGTFAIPGVFNTGAPVQLDFISPAGTAGRGLLPAQHVTTALQIGERAIAATLIDAATPSVFVQAGDLSLSAAIAPAELDAMPDMMATLEDLRRQASVKMGLTADMAAAAAKISIPKIAIVGPAVDYDTLSREKVEALAQDITARMISAGQTHRAFPITGSLALAAAAAVPGSVVSACLGEESDIANLRIGSPSGIITVGATIEPSSDGAPVVQAARIMRTQRRLFEGRVTIPFSLTAELTGAPRAEP